MVNFEAHSTADSLRITGQPEVILTEVGFVEVKSLFTFYPASTDLPCEVTAYDWSCNQMHDGARFFGEVASLMFPFPRG